MDNRAWIVSLVAALFIAALVVAYYLGLLGNRAVPESAPAREDSMVSPDLYFAGVTSSRPPL